MVTKNLQLNYTYGNNKLLADVIEYLR